MFKANRKAVATAAVMVIFLLIASSLRLIHGGHPLLHTMRSLLVFLIYISMISTWGISAIQRIMHKRIKLYLTITVAGMLLLIFIRTLKHRVVVDLLPWERYAWYAFYIPMLFFPLLFFWAALCFGKSEDYRPEFKYRLLIIPTVLLILGVLTNEIHQLAFIIFDDQIKIKETYTHHVLYYAVGGWIITLTLIAILQLYRKSRVPGTQKRVWMPLGFILIGIVYTILYIIDSSSNRFGFIEMAAMICVVTGGVWESCIQTGLIPANTNYQTIFMGSPLAAQIIDAIGQVCYKSVHAVPIDDKIFTDLIKYKTVRFDENNELNMEKIHSGYVVWQEDISHINHLIEQLKQTGQELKNQTDLIKNEYITKAQQESLKERIRIYNLLAKQTKSQLEHIKKILEEIPYADNQMQRKLFIKANILGVYIKRRCNLSLISEAGEKVTGETMRQTFNESLESLRLNGVEPIITVNIATELNHDYAMSCYDLFENVVEKHINTLKKIIISFKSENEHINFNIKATGEDISCFEFLPDLGFTFTCRAETDDTINITLSIPIEVSL